MVFILNSLLCSILETDKMKFIYKGVRYKNIPELSNFTCDGCEFNIDDCNDIPQSKNCGNKHIIFIKTKKQPQNKYQYWEGNIVPPVEANTLVDIIYRNNSKSTAVASSYRWNHTDEVEFSYVDIIAWRLHIEN